ncbi:hypothetical protein VOLCADRAFT_96377 [Volvox carteri f. nagariensis]|uniref:Inositol oxygenase n=1 Tax=Volvox carteri f. nagariensis TaxID=3068 RepID=D8U9Z0_VOLCA|nr:uncharacterized protein VOLCADRAFT_96377 [Volvox carteri f. nagariensis]EFJ43495.1 hypothetical protein VOLCADRAFT_96377 [Volvox carteri f. nagariensis]|eukprot:XP_002955424.1 hypothetical protein VOLCADRAFT_96377 [Volvox carteri f. nagariensis]
MDLQATCSSQTNVTYTRSRIVAELVLLQAMRESVAQNFGDYGMGTNIASLQAERERVITSLALMTQIKQRPASVRVLRLAGTLATCRDAALQLSEYKLRQLGRISTPPLPPSGQQQQSAPAKKRQQQQQLLTKQVSGVTLGRVGAAGSRRRSPLADKCRRAVAETGFAGDGPSSEEQACTGLGRPGDDYISYPMKKSRSHNSMVQTTETALEAEDECGYVVTSAPDNTYCVIDPDSEDDANSACGCDKDGGNTAESEGADGGGLTGVFGSVSPDQWAAFKVAVSGGHDAVQACAECSTGSAGVVVGVEPSSTAHRHQYPHRNRRHYQLHQLYMPRREEGQARSCTTAAAAAAAVAVLPPKTAASAGLDGVVTPAAVAAAAAPDLLTADITLMAKTAAGGSGADCSGGDGGGDAVGSVEVVADQGTSPGGSASSIASLWAAVTSMAGTAVYDSTDDNAQAGQMLSRYRGWSNAAAAVAVAAAPAAPVVAPESALRAGAAGGGGGGGGASAVHRLRHHSAPAPQVPLSYTHQHQYSHSILAQPPNENNLPANARTVRDNQLGVDLAVHRTHQVDVTHPALAVLPEDGGGGGGGGGSAAFSQPGSPAAAAAAARTASCSADLGSSSSLLAARSMLLRECYDPESQPPLGGCSSSASMTVDGYYSHCDGLDHGYGGGALPHQAASYTTYGYRRACSSLAALEQSNAAAAAGVGVGVVGLSSSSDDDDESELEGHRLLTAFRTHTGSMTARNTGWGLLGTDPGPITFGMEPARRDPWAVATAAASAAAAHGGGGGVSAVGHGSFHNAGGGTASGMASGEGGGGSGEMAGRRGEGCGGGGGGGGGDGSGVDGSSSSATPTATATATAASEDAVGEGCHQVLPAGRCRSSYHLTNSHAAVELFLRLNHARQTMDFVKRQLKTQPKLPPPPPPPPPPSLTRCTKLILLTSCGVRHLQTQLFASLDKAHMTEISELSLLDHAFQTAELCRLHHPDLDWLHLVGLVHGLGKLLAHRRFGAQPQWAVCGETYPLGCRFSPHILGSQYFTANPDRRRRLYNSPTGLYAPGCGLFNMVMSWSAPEYLYLVLMLNTTHMPQDALWVLRHAKFSSLTRPHSCYLPLCSAEDLRRLPLLRSFQSLAAYRRVPLPAGFALQGEQRTAYYSGLVRKYLGEGALHW